MEIRRIPAPDTWLLRQEVMWPEKDLDFVKLPEDSDGAHYGLFEDGNLVSVISLFVTGQTAQFRKFATRQNRQGKGYGTELLRFVLEEARQMGVRTIWCSARISKAAYYEKLGLQRTENRFEREGVEYVVMRKCLIGLENS